MSERKMVSQPTNHWDFTEKHEDHHNEALGWRVIPLGKVFRIQILKSHALRCGIRFRCGYIFHMTTHNIYIYIHIYIYIYVHAVLKISGQTQYTLRQIFPRSSQQPTASHCWQVYPFFTHWICINMIKYVYTPISYIVNIIHSY